MGEGNEQGREIRRCAQEIFTAHVVTRDSKLRDQLIHEYLTEHGDHLVNMVCGFINHHLTGTVSRDLAEACYFAMSSTLGELIESVAQLSGRSATEIVGELTQISYATGVDSESADVAQANLALAAAQTCLIAHMLVRDGGQPWGIQKNLDLDDMCAVVQQFGVLLHLVANRPELPADAIIQGLLSHVERILVAYAFANHVPVSQYVAGAWQALALSDLEEESA